MPETWRQIVQAFAGAFKGMRLYPADHPAVKRQIRSLWEALNRALEEREQLKIGLMQGTLFMEEHLFADQTPVAEELVRLLDSLKLEGLQFSAGLEEEELRTLLVLIVGGGGKGAALERALHQRGVTHIHPVSREEAEEEEKRDPPRKVYGRALKVVDQIFRDVRMGKIPSSSEAMTVVRSMVRLTLAEPHALFALSMLKDYDNYTFTHSVNVSVIALAVGRACEVSEEQLRILGLGGLLHDLGKLKIDHQIINKPGRLTEEEFEKIRTHPRTGAGIAAEMEGVTEEVIDIVLGHHLRFDREGYPEDARGHDISPLTEMAAIADTYDAITTLRSYQRPMTPRKATARLRELTGTVLNPEYTEKFITSLGTYPVGSLVRLDTNEIGLVVWVDTRDPDSVRLKILFDREGIRLDNPQILELFGPAAKRIVAEVDPFSKGIEVTEHFDL